jgi:hypothetical protein
MSLLRFIDDVLVSAGRRGECIALAAILALLLCSKDLRTILQCAPRRYVIFLGLFFAVASAAQVGTRGQYVYPQRSEPFPLTRFAMFTEVSPSQRTQAITYHFLGHTQNDETVTLNPLHLLPTIDFSTFHTRVRTMGDWLNSGDAAKRDAAERVLKQFARTMALRYSEHNPGAAIDEVDVVRRVIDLRLPSRDQPTAESVIVTERTPGAAR